LSLSEKGLMNSKIVFAFTHNDLADFQQKSLSSMVKGFTF